MYQLYIHAPGATELAQCGTELIQVIHRPAIIRNNIKTPRNKQVNRFYNLTLTKLTWEIENVNGDLRDIDWWTETKTH